MLSQPIYLSIHSYDWDDTIIINDVTDKFFLYQIDNQAFKLSPEECQYIPTTNNPSQPGDPIAHSCDGHPLAFIALTRDLSNGYELLHQNYIGKPAPRWSTPGRSFSVAT
ncbi:hypothetical protein [Pseudomonas sp. TE21394]